MNNNIERRPEVEQFTSEMLLDMGVSVQLRTPKIRWLKPLFRVKIRRPYLGGLIRIANIASKIDITAEQIEDMSKHELNQFVAKHGKTIVSMIVHCIARGWLSGKLLHAYYRFMLLWIAEPCVLINIWIVLINNLNLTDFLIITKSYLLLNPLSPKV